MSDEQTPALEAGDEVVQTEVEQAEAAEAPESTEGQDETPPAKDEDGSVGEKPDDQSEAEDKSPSKLRRERRKAHEERLRQEAAEERSKRKKLEEKISAIEDAASSITPPNQADYQDHSEYLLAFGAWQAGNQFDIRQKAEIQREAQASDERLQQLQAEEKEAARESWAAQATEAKSRYADFDAVVGAPDVHITDEMARIIATSDNGADVAYHLGTHKDVAAQIAQLPPIEQARAIGRLEATISMPKPRTQSNAPEPISPVKAKASAAKDPQKMSFAEYKAARDSGKV